MNQANSRHLPVELLGHFVPPEVLGRMRELALQLRRDEQVRTYIVERWWLLLIAGSGAMSLSSGVTAIAFDYVFRLLRPGPWVVGVAAIALAALWIGATIGQLYLLFAWLEKRALRDLGLATSYSGRNVANRD